MTVVVSFFALLPPDLTDVELMLEFEDRFPDMFDSGVVSCDFWLPLTFAPSTAVTEFELFAVDTNFDEHESDCVAALAPPLVLAIIIVLDTADIDAPLL